MDGRDTNPFDVVGGPDGDLGTGEESDPKPTAARLWPGWNREKRMIQFAALPVHRATPGPRLSSLGKLLRRQRPK